MTRPMTPTWHAERTPDAVAVIMGSSGETTTYAELEDRSTRLARALRLRGIAEGDHIAILMENNRPFLEVAWAAQRSGLHYTAINSHLRPAEVQYVLDDCGASVLVASEAVADAVAGLDLSRISVRVAGAGDLPGFERYEDVLAATGAGPLEDESEGREMLYSSGTTGVPTGVRKPRPGTPFGDPSSAPVQVAQGIGAVGGGPGSVYLSPAPMYHSAPLVYSMSMHRLGATVVVMERFDPELCLELIER
ncbi:MAG: AMP-binding protein, partial [Acidimicrobiales bacterium]